MSDEWKAVDSAKTHKARGFLDKKSLAFIRFYDFFNQLLIVLFKLYKTS